MKKRTDGNEFYKKLLTIAPSTYDASRYDFQQHLKKCFDKYLRWLDEYGLDNIKASNAKTIDLIKEAVQLYYEGRHSKAFECIKDHLSYLWDHRNFPFEDFYRMRTFDEGEIHDCEGMFHIPFNKRTIVKTQRYSAPGYPCLYLGTSAYICWEEMLRPNLDKCYVSRFHTDEPITLFDLTLPPQKIVKNTDLYDLLRFPLIIASMVKVANPKDPFKPEYIIPQLLMEWIIDQRSERSNNRIMGIAYTSVQKSYDFNFSPLKSINVAIPAFSPFEGNYSEELCEMFQLTNPTCDELERAKRPYEIIERDRDMTDLEYSYRISTFGQLEARLNDVTKFPLKKIKKREDNNKKIK